MPARSLPPADAISKARLLAAVADPARLRIIQCLRGGPQTVGRIATALGLAMINASHHLSILRQAGILRDTRRGRFIEYALSPAVFRPAARAGEADRLDLGGLRLHLDG